MLIYQKSIFKQLSFFFLLICFVCSAIVWLGQALKLVYLLTKGVSLITFFNLTLLTLPTLLLTIIPISLFLSSAIYLNKIKNDREMIVMENSGLSYLGITYPLIKLSLILIIISYIFSLFLLPYSYNKLKNKLDNLRENFTATLLDSKTFNSVNKNITVYFDKKISKDILSKIVIFDYRDEKQPAIIFAKLGKLIIQEKAIVFHLMNGSRQFKDSNDNIEIMQFDHLTVSILIPNNQKVRNNIESQEKYISELLYNKELSILRKNQLRAEGHQRIVWPLFNITLVMIAAVMIIPRNYERRSSIKNVIAACVLAMVVILLNFFLTSQVTKKPYMQYFVYINVLCPIVVSYIILQNKISNIKFINNIRF